MNILGFSKRRMSKRAMRKAIDQEVKAFEQDLRDQGIPFSIPVDGKNSAGKIYQGDN